MPKEDKAQSQDIDYQCPMTCFLCSIVWGLKWLLALLILAE